MCPERNMVMQGGMKRKRDGNYMKKPKIIWTTENCNSNSYEFKIHA